MPFSADHQQSGQTPRILIVDDHPLVCSFLSMLLEQASMKVCGAAGNVATALALFEQHRPDLVIIDISLDASNGLDLIRQLRNHNKAVKTLVLSSHNGPVYAQHAREAGALGYLNKQANPDAILDAVRTLLDGGDCWSDLDETAPAASPSVASLSKREREVFELIGSGFGTSEIANRLSLSVKTIETHRANIRRKLGLPSGNALVREAVQWVYEQG